MASDMGTQERKQREREAREALFLDTAERMIAETGFMKLQMGPLAAACDYATGTLYQHFQSKEDLLLALVVREVEAHLDFFRQVDRWQGGSPRERMVAIAVAELEFARRHPQHMKLKHYVLTEAVWEQTSESRRAEALACSGPMSEIVNRIVRDAVEAGDLDTRGLSLTATSLGPWSLCEGMTALGQVQGLMEALQIADSERLRFRHLQALLNGMGWQPQVDFADEQGTAELVARIRREVFEFTRP